MPLNITPAVDSLVELVDSRKKISLQGAAEELGLPEHIINEWAVFLEEENVLEIQYEFTTPFLIAKYKKEAGEKEEYSREIEILTRDLEVLLAHLNKIQINHEIKLKDIDDVKSLLSKKTGIDNDVVYAQKFVLEYQINRILNKAKKLKTFAKKDYDSLNQEFEDIKKRKLIFDRNLAKVK